MGQLSERLRKLLAGTRKTSDQAQKSFLKAEDVLSSLEDREQARVARSTTGRSQGRS